MPLTNRWNQFIYRLWAPVYDRTFTRLFAVGRRQAIAALAPQPGQRLLLAGVGTGADLPLLPPGVQVVGVDLSPAMLRHARRRQARGTADVLLIQADAQALPLGDGVCDAALLNLIVSVVPDGGACLRETVRALRPSGRIVIFDKFLPDTARLGIIRRLLNAGARWFGTDINRRLSDILANSRCVVELNLPSLARGVYRVVVIKPLLSA
jgi:phosphatidylethanolamine/phosphatidyl-N-methylethanolamine N-methyltransferase